MRNLTLAQAKVDFSFYFVCLTGRGYYDVPDDCLPTHAGMETGVLKN